MGTHSAWWIDSHGNLWVSGTFSSCQPICVLERIPSDELELTAEDKAMLEGMRIRVDCAAD